MSHKFHPKPGRVDYTDIRYAPVVDCFLRHNGKILIVKRSDDIRLYTGYWHIISGFLDDNKNFDDKVKEEIFEETGIDAEDILEIKIGRVLVIDDPAYKKTWIVFSVLADVTTDKIKLDWESSQYTWIKPEDFEEYEFIPSFGQVIQAIREIL